MKVDPITFNKNLSQLSFKKNGDTFELHYGDSIIQHFPNCEKYWKNFIVPLTYRIEPDPKDIENIIRFRPSIDLRLQNLSNIHYCTFLNLIFAYEDLESRRLSYLGDFYIHLGTTCDLVEAFLEKWYLLLLECRGQTTEILQGLSRDGFLHIAGKLYDKQYAKLYENYLSKGKSRPLHLPGRTNIIQECIEQYFKQPDIWKEYFNFSKTIREFRNVIAHDLQISTIISDKGTLIPKPILIQTYRTWHEVGEASKNLEKVEQDFVPARSQMRSDLENLQKIVNNLWTILLKEIESEFYSSERKQLREMYQIEF